MKQYLRFGHIPKDKKSKAHKSDVVIREEKGVSVWDCAFVNDVPFPLLPINASESAMADYFYCLLGNKPVYLVEGTELAEKGSAGEPLLDTDISIIQEYTIDYNYLKRILRRTVFDIDNTTPVSDNTTNENVELNPSYNGVKSELESCEDCISRQAVIDGINEYFHDEYYQRTSIQDCRDCLIEDVIKDMPPVTPQPKTGHCKDCKWWKDSDGSFKRGIGAESKCPINREEVYEGNGYCFLYEPQESEE